MRDATSFSFSKDSGKYAENTVFQMLRRITDKVYYWGSPYKAMQVGGIGKNYAHNVLILLERTHENVGRKLLKLLTCIAL